jgi:hypothetical protein
VSLPVPDQFDPARHRVWAVDVTHSYRTYVVAETVDEAEVAAAAPAGEQVAGYDVQQLKVPLRESDAALPWGPARWGRRYLTVNEALRLIRRPRPAPPVIAADQLRVLGGWEWVRLAAAVDWRRPVLRAVLVSGGLAVASDRKRLHLAPVPCRDGLWDAELMEPVAGHYPEYEPALEREGPLMELCDLAGAWQVLQAARPGLVQVPCGPRRCTLDAAQLAEALLGAATAERVLLSAAAGGTAVRFDFPDLGRTAVLARVPGRHPDADLSLFVRLRADGR